MAEHSPQDAPGVLDRLLHPFRPSPKRRNTANQLNTASQGSTTSVTSLASSSGARSRRSGSSPRPPSIRSASGGQGSFGASSPAPDGVDANTTGVAASSGDHAMLVADPSDTTRSGAASPRPSADMTNNSRYSLTGSFGSDQHNPSENRTRQTTVQTSSPLASPHQSQPNIGRNLSSSSLLSPPQDAASSSRPGIGRRQSSSRRLATALTRPFFRRSSSQKSVMLKAADRGVSRVQPLSSNVASTSTSPAATDSSGSSGGYISQQRPTTASTASGPPSPATGQPASSGGRRQFTVSSTTTRSAISSQTGTATTPLAAVDTSQRAFPSPFFAQSTPTTSHASNPFAPPIDCIPVLATALAQPITSTLLQLVPLSLMSPYAAPQGLCSPHGLGSLPSASSVSIASSAISEAPTASSIHPSSASFTSNPSSSSNAIVSNEQLAASSLSIPTTALATIWRQAKASEWLHQHGDALNAIIHNRTNPMTPRASTTSHNFGQLPSLATSNTPLNTATPDEGTPPGGPTTFPVFDFSALLQSVLDCLAAIASERNINIVYFHGSRHQYYPENRRPSSGGDEARPGESQEVQEAFVRGDERGLGVALLVMLRQVMADLAPGMTLEVGLSISLTVPPVKQAGNKGGQDLSALELDSDDEEDEFTTRLGTYMLTIELTSSRSTHATTGSQSSSGSTSEDDAVPPAGEGLKVDPLICSALFQYLHLSFMTLPKKDDRQEYKITCALPQARKPGRANPNFDPTLRRRKSIDQSRQPSLFELLRFAENSLRGKKVALHALEHSTFAHHLSHHLANWGLEVTHVSIASEDDAESTTARAPVGPGHLGRYDSGFGGSDGPSPPQFAATPVALNMNDPMASAFNYQRTDGPISAATSPPVDPTLNFIIIDDDVASLRKQIMALKANAPTLQLQNALLAKRPQLQSRRTRSTQAVQRTVHTPASIIHFTSLSQYRQIKEIVHATLRTASPMSALPEVLVVPKPAGPRRLLNTLYNAVRRPAIDPHFLPIATSPSSPGAQYFFSGSRPSPAPSNQNEFDAAAAAELSRQRNEYSLSAAASQASGPRTPPVPGQASNPPSPASPDAMEYFSKSASELGSSASQGIIIQSPDGRPTGLFFQPRAASLAEKAESLHMSRNGESDSSSEKENARTSSTTSSNRAPKLSPALGQLQALTKSNGSELPSIVIPENMDFTNTRSFSVTPSQTSPRPTPTSHLSQRSSQSGQDVNADDSAIKNNLKRTLSGGRASEDLNSSDDSLDKQAEKSQTEAAPATPRPPIVTSPPVKSPASPPLDRPERQPVLSPINTSNKPTSATSADLKTPISKDSGDLVQTPVAPSLRGKSERKSSGRVKKTPRPPSGTLVPPINVLIVEDNPINQIILSTFLKRKGIKYSVANNGQEAVDQWKAGDFHLVLMDIQLPVKDGIEATQEIRAMERANSMQFTMTPASESSNPMSAPTSSVSSPYELPVIIVALTASNLQSDRVNALAAGCNDFLTKPVSLQWLNQKLVEWGSMAYLSGFSSKRRSTVSSPREGMRRTKSIGSQAAQLVSRLESEKRKVDTITEEGTAAAPTAVGGDETPRTVPEEGAQSAL